MSKILVLGIGNLLLSDDGAGIKVVEEIRKRKIPGVVSKEFLTDFDLIEAIYENYSHIVVVDVIKTGNKPGTIYRASIEDIPVRLSTHSSCFELLKSSELPVTLIAIEAKDTESISERCTPEIQRAIYEVLNIIKNLPVSNYH